MGRRRLLLPATVVLLVALFAAAPLATAAGIPAYSRSDYRHWIDADGDCQNTRTEVLIEESTVPVTLSADDCHVVSGRWIDPWTGAVVTDPSKLDIDHQVPLGNAHASGGWAWDRAEKQAYANSLEFADHLIAITARANRQKGQRAPLLCAVRGEEAGCDGWVPPLRSSWCRYARSWAAIKRRWQLTLTVDEAAGLWAMLGTCPAPGTE